MRADCTDESPFGSAGAECAFCHRANTSGELDTQSAINQVCLDCHGPDGQANTDVTVGRYLVGRDDIGANEDIGARQTSDGAALLGGGFYSYVGKESSSAHDLAGSSEHPDALLCTSCHDPHGSSNYRHLRAQINDRDVSVEAVDEGAAKDFDTEQWGVGMDSLCEACHLDDPQDDAKTSYSHPTGMPYNYGENVNPETIGYEGYFLPLAQSGNGDLVVCMTCHRPHGTSARPASGFADSDLLRLDGRGVCQVCHQM